MGEGGNGGDFSCKPNALRGPAGGADTVGEEIIARVRRR